MSYQLRDYNYIGKDIKVAISRRNPDYGGSVYTTDFTWPTSLLAKNVIGNIYLRSQIRAVYGFSGIFLVFGIECKHILMRWISCNQIHGIYLYNKFPNMWISLQNKKLIDYETSGTILSIAKHPYAGKQDVAKYKRSASSYNHTQKYIYQ